jgi:hypothetical protein
MLGNTTHNTDGNGRASDEGEKMMWSVRARERERTKRGSNKNKHTKRRKRKAS